MENDGENVITILDGEITFKNRNNTTKSFDEIKIGGCWVYARKGTVERWFHMHRIHEIRRDL